MIEKSIEDGIKNKSIDKNKIIINNSNKVVNAIELYK